MDAPPAKEDSLRFVRVAGFLESMQLNAPRLLEADMDNGFLLLTDLGEELYLRRLKTDPDSADSLYGDAIDALQRIQSHGAAFQDSLPPYDEKLLRFELSLFRDWLCGTHLELKFSEADEQNWQAAADRLVDNAVSQPQVFVHRDYHSRNLMVVESDNPGILDFQDAVEGPLTYDLVSLLKDSYISWPQDAVRNWALSFYRELGDALRDRVDEQQFMRYFELMGVQRHLKVAGIFCRLNYRDGKSAYLREVPQALAYIVELGSRYEELEFLVPLIEERILPAWDSAL